MLSIQFYEVPCLRCYSKDFEDLAKTLYNYGKRMECIEKSIVQRHLYDFNYFGPCLWILLS